MVGKGNVLPVVLFVAAVAAVSIGGYFWWILKPVIPGNTPTATKNTLSPTSTPNNENLTPDEAQKIPPLPDPTTNWKTYKNVKYQFSFSYPPTFMMRADATSEFIGFPERLNENSSQKLVVSVINNPLNSNLKDFFQKNKPVPDDRINVTFENRTTGSYDALTTRYELPCSGLCEGVATSKHFMVSIKGNKFIVSLSVENTSKEGNTKVDEKWLDQILSTFKFL